MKEIEKFKKIINDIFSTDLESESRKREVVDARKVYAKILRDNGYRYEKIANSIKKDHSTIVHYIKNIDNILSYDKQLMDKYIDCELAFIRTKKYELNDMLNDFNKHIDFYERHNGKSLVTFKMRSTITSLFNE